jgi:hypothetical protein
MLHYPSVCSLRKSYTESHYILNCICWDLVFRSFANIFLIYCQFLIDVCTVSVVKLEAITRTRKAKAEDGACQQSNWLTEIVELANILLPFANMLKCEIDNSHLGLTLSNYYFVAKSSLGDVLSLERLLSTWFREFNCFQCSWEGQVAISNKNGMVRANNGAAYVASHKLHWSIYLSH